MTSTKTKPKSEISEVEKKWSKPLVDAGWTAIPSVIFERQRALGLDPLDINIILHLAGYWWKAGNAPHPSKATIAAAIDVDPRTIQRRIAKLEGAGFIARIARSSKKGGTTTNQYSFDGLIKAATPYALERIEDKKRRISEATERAKRKKPQLTVVK
jgi:predicted transcriptional regulator